MSEACNTLNMDKEPGFTLVELLIAIVVVSILLAAGAPAFKDFIKNNRVTSSNQWACLRHPASAQRSPETWNEHGGVRQF